jgi:HK97 family phage portal protein
MFLETYRYAGGTSVKIENPIFVNRPSIDETRRDLLYSLVVDLALYGNAYLLKQNDSQGRIVQVFQLPAFAVTVRYNDAGTEKLFDYNNKTYTSLDIEHLRLMPRSGYAKGTSILETCSPDVKGALDLRDYQSNWFSASGVPTGVIKSSRDLTAADAEAMTAAWHTKQATRQIAVLGNGFDFQHVQLSPRDALMTEVASQSVQQIARMFGVPARLLLTGVDGSSDTYTNLQDENQVFYRHTLMAYTDVIAEALSNCLPRGTRVAFDYQSLFAADMETRFNMYATALAGEPFMTVDEVRERENL